MGIYEILKSFVIDFKSKYNGTITNLCIEGMGIPTDNDFINISLYSKTARIYDKVRNHQAEPCIIMVSINLYKNSNPYPTQVNEIENILNNMRDFSLYDFTVVPAQPTTVYIDIDEKSPPLPLKYGDFLTVSWLIYCIKVN